MSVNVGVAVLPSRYGSALGGSEWLAFSVVDAGQLPLSPWGDDNQCSTFFNEDGFADRMLHKRDKGVLEMFADSLDERAIWFNEDGTARFGRGKSAKEAFDDLRKKCPQATDVLVEIT